MWYYTAPWFLFQPQSKYYTYFIHAWAIDHSITDSISHTNKLPHIYLGQNGSKLYAGAVDQTLNIYVQAFLCNTVYVFALNIANAQQFQIYHTDLFHH